MRTLCAVFCFCLALSSCVDGANILFLGDTATPSHFIWCNSLLKSLHKRGHNITALSPDVEKSTEGLTYIHLEKVYPALYNGSEEINFLENGKLTFVALYKKFMGYTIIACNASLSSKGYQQLLNYPEEFNFDLVLHDSSISNCLLGLVHHFNNPPVVALSPYLLTVKMLRLSGSPLFVAFSPPQEAALTQVMTFDERVRTVIQVLVEMAFEFWTVQSNNELVQQMHPGIPYIEDIEQKTTKMLLVNVQPITDYRQPAFANVKLVGGTQIQKPKALPAELKKVADAATNGLVLFSLGTNVRSDSLGEERIVKILKALSRLPKFTFLWKFETKEKLPVELPKNVVIQSWMPQNDVLAHNNTKLFISHCGLLSTQEALWYGVPVLGFPIFVDQPQNALRLKTLGVGRVMSIHDFTEKELYGTIKDLIETPSYQAKAKQIASALRDQPMTPLEEATYWTEWLLRHPEIDLTSPSLNLSLFVRHSLDVFTFFFVIVLLCLYACFKACKIFSSMFRKDKVVNKKIKLN